MDKAINLLVRSWLTPEGMYKTDGVLAWVQGLNESVFVNIQKTTLSQTGWFYDEALGQIVNEKRSFFQIGGFRQIRDDHVSEQPIIIQDEIGFLGILCKVFDGVLHLLMQAKIEPGNVNKIQISPTIQATKSNFTRQHGGASPLYLEHFLKASQHRIVFDQIQSEQSSRFLKKRNRNIVVIVDDTTNIEESPYHKWLTLGQIKELMKIDNLVNMDTRTVISCIPFHHGIDPIEIYPYIPSDPTLLRSITQGFQRSAAPDIYSYFNNYKMFSDINSQLIPLYALKDWEMCVHDDTEAFIHKNGWPFKVVFCDIAIEGREVRNWGQPLFEAVGKATLGLFTTVEDGLREFLVYARPEIGCFDHIELGPTVQIEGCDSQEPDQVTELFLKLYKNRIGCIYDVIMSEEGGRFYHEENLNVIIEIDKKELPDLPEGYFWLTYHTLNSFMQVNNCVNIQLRNLLSLLKL